MNKYTPETALAIKRDVQKAENMLTLILREIEEAKRELRGYDVILDEKRSLVARFEDMVYGVFSRGESKVQEKEKHILTLENNISKLETARDLLNAEIGLRKEQIVEPAGAVLVKSLIAQLEPILDKLLTDINESETNLSQLQQKKVEFQQANKILAKEISEQEKQVDKARFAAKAAHEKREKTLKALTQEQQKLTIIRQRERDGSAMNRRLSAEYLKVYEKTPRRNKKK